MPTIPYERTEPTRAFLCKQFRSFSKKIFRNLRNLIAAADRDCEADVVAIPVTWETEPRSVSRSCEVPSFFRSIFRLPYAWKLRSALLLYTHPGPK